MSGRQITTVATHTARSIRRRLSAAARERRGQHAPRAQGLGRPPVAGDSRVADTPPAEAEAAGAGAADDARLDTLRGELVHELDQLAARDQGCSAGFRRI
jgi:hypothetical protein